MVVNPAFEALKGRFSNDELSYLHASLNGPEPFITPALIVAAAHEVLTYMPFEPAAEVFKRRGMIFVRADSSCGRKQGVPWGRARHCNVKVAL